MIRRKARKTIYKRRTARKGYSRSRYGAIGKGYLDTLPRNRLEFPFPPSVCVKMRTSISCNIAVNAGAIAGNPLEYVFGLNKVNKGPTINYPLGTIASGSRYVGVPSGIYDLLSVNSPVISGASAAPYYQYMIKRSYIRVEYCPEGTANKTVQVLIYPTPYDNTINPSVVSSGIVAEQPLTKNWLVPPVLNDKPHVFTHSISVKELFGLDNLGNQNSEFTGEVTANPPNTASWTVRISNADNTSLNAITSTMKVYIIDDFEFFNRNVLNSSVPAGQIG